MASKNEPDHNPLAKLLGETVVIDTDSNYVYLGKLVQVHDQFLCLDEVDVHETNDASLSKETYIHESKDIGLRINRKMTYVNMQRVISVSKWTDIVEF